MQFSKQGLDALLYHGSVLSVKTGSGLSVNQHLNLKYGPEERNYLDIYYPEEGEKPYKVIIFFHGGAFMKGDKGRYQFRPALEGLEYGYAVVSANYRILPSDVMPQSIWDAKAVIRYLKRNSNKLMIDADAIAVWGESAGATLACFVGMTEGNTRFENLSMGNETENTKVKAVIDWYGPVNMKLQEKLDSKKNQLCMPDGSTFYEAIFKAKGDELLEKMEDMNLERYLHEEMPPILIEHGMDDSTVPITCSEHFRNCLYEFMPEERVEYVAVPGAEHGVADLILVAIGTQENVSYCGHCMTRLRINVKDKSLVQVDKLKAMKKVAGCQWVGEQLQIIIGTQVDTVYLYICELGDIKTTRQITENLDKSKEKVTLKSTGGKIMNYLSGSMVQILPMLITAGLIKAIQVILGPTLLNIIGVDHSIYLLLDLVYNAGFYFLPIYLGFAAAKFLGASPALGMLMGGDFNFSYITQFGYGRNNHRFLWNSNCIIGL